MIITKLMGGHSNQLFQYATARRLAHKHNTELRLDLSWFDNIASTDTPRFYELDDYPIKAQPIDISSISLRSPDKAPSVLERSRHRLGFDKRIWTLGEPSKAFFKAVLTASDNTYLIGWWQNEKYFQDIRPILLKEFEPKTPMSAANKKYLEQIKSGESVSLHVRRADYVKNIHARKHHGTMSLTYYQKALQLIQDRLPDKPLKLFVISDDIAWCKKNLQFSLPIVFIEGNKKGSDDMRLMKHCQHNIIANSTFSWWGAWLNNNPQKIIVAPKVWFLDEKANNETEIIPKSWVRL